MPTPQPPSVESPAPDPSPGEKPDDTPATKTYTEEEVQELLDKRLRGQGKELKAALAKVEALTKEEEKRKQAEMTEAEKLQAENAELKKRAALADELEVKEQARVDALKERNAERLKTLPRGAKDKAKKWSEKLPPDDFADFLNDMEQAVEVRDVKHGGKVKEPSDGGEKLTSKDPLLADWSGEEGDQ